MQKKILNKYFILLAVLTSPSFIHGQSVQEITPEVEMTTLAIEMSAPQINTAHLQSFHIRAEQKLNDFIEIISLVSDPETPTELRKDIINAAPDLFLDKNTKVQWHYFKNGQDISLPFMKFLHKVMHENIKIKTIIKNIENNRPNNCPAPQCKWQLFFQLEQKDYHGNTNKTDAVMDVILKLETKKFGSTEKEIWTVFLGELKDQTKRP